MSAMTNTRKQACPDDEAFARYVDGLLNADEQRDVERHFSDCEPCQVVMTSLREVSAHARRDGLLPVPRGLTNRVKRLWRKIGKRDVLEILVEFTARAASALRTTGTIVRGIEARPALALRRQASEPPRTLIVQQSLDHRLVQVEMTRVDRRRHVIAIHVKTRWPGSSSGNMRATVKRGAMELESHPLRQGRAVFEGLAPGRYLIELEQRQHRCGTIALCFTSLERSSSDAS